MILIIDNYDSFTYNLYQMLSGFPYPLKVIRNDEMTVDELKQLDIHSIIISPGPGTPKEAGICIDVIKTFADKIPIFGVCLGHQSMGEAFGGNVVGAGEIVHGKSCQVHHKNRGIFTGLPSPFQAARYHSLIIEKSSLPSELIVEAETEGGMIMAVKHRDYPCYGVQFHPESILTPQGDLLVRNFLEIGGRYVKAVH